MDKKISVLILTLLMLFVSVNTAIATTGNLKVDWLIDKGYVQGDSNGYRLNDNITRAETTKMVVEAGGLGAYVDSYKNLVSMFNDMNKNHWANGYVNVAVINLLVNGYPNGSFIPNNNITYAEVIKMLVMANGDKPNTEMYSGALWSVPYIVKANEVGITEGVNISNYHENATREKVFELVFNTMFKEEPVVIEGYEEEYKGIIIENKRVAGLKVTEISLVVFENLDSTSDSPPRYKINDKIKITLPKRIEDVEYLLGKVVDITIDNNNNTSNLKVDNSYSYLEGPILASDNEVYLGTNGEYYDVYLDDRSSSRIDRILGVYHNDEGYDYDDYIDELGDYDASRNITFLAEYARLTIKNSKTYFIDSYTFSDISPVSRVSRSDIYIYDDRDNASVSLTSIDNVIGYTYNWGLESLDPRDIKEGDIVHIYSKDSAIVRRDPENYGLFYELFEDSGYYFVDIDGYTYQVRVSEDRRPIYSLDGIEYSTLYAEDPEDDLYDLLDQDITYLLDINGHIQAIQSR